MKKMIIDSHHHDQGGPDYVDLLAEHYAMVGIDKVCLISQSGEEGLERMKGWMRKYPDLVLGLAQLDWENHTPDDIARFKDDGFAGVKFIRPPACYNDKRFWPIYEKCQEMGLPGLFHLGIVGRGGRTKSGLQSGATPDSMQNGYFVDSNYMRPIYLDTLARLFPAWTIHGAHLGNPWYEEASMSARWNPNLYFDLTGSTLKKKTPEFLGGLLWWNRFTRYRDPNGRDAWEKIIFGTDVAYFEAQDLLHDYDHVIRTLGLSEEIKWKILGGTAAQIYGVAE